MLSRLCVTRSILQSNCLLKTPVPRQFIPRNYLARDYSRPARTRIQTKTGPTLWERAMAPAGPNAFSLGKGALAGASALALGSLCYYGVFSSKPGIVQEAYVWPQYVKDRIKTTYGYIGGSLALTAASAAAVFRSPTMLNLVARNGWMSVIATLALMIGSGMVARGIEYQPGLGGKQLAWMLHTGIVGAVIAPMCFLGGPIIIRAAWYTAGVVGGLSTVAVCAPSGEFLNLGAPLAMGLGAVFAASLASMFLPPTTALGAGLYSLSLYGGLILFSGFLLYDTQKIIKRAETHPAYSIQQYDPINAAMSVYMDTINIFIRIASILAGGGSRRK